MSLALGPGKGMAGGDLAKRKGLGSTLVVGFPACQHKKLLGVESGGPF